jgi:hypothetical protein
MKWNTAILYHLNSLLVITDYISVWIVRAEYKLRGRVSYSKRLILLKEYSNVFGNNN